MKTTAIKLLLNAKAKGIVPKPALVAEAGDEATEMVSMLIDTVGRLATAFEKFNENRAIALEMQSRTCVHGFDL